MQILTDFGGGIFFGKRKVCELGPMGLEGIYKYIYILLINKVFTLTA